MKKLFDIGQRVVLKSYREYSFQCKNKVFKIVEPVTGHFERWDVIIEMENEGFRFYANLDNLMPAEGEPLEMSVKVE
jgi:hypothetical protein